MASFYVKIIHTYTHVYIYTYIYICAWCVYTHAHSLVGMITSDFVFFFRLKFFFPDFQQCITFITEKC